MARIAAIAAMDESRVIGVKNQLPWRIPEDMKRFSSLTIGKSVLMGRKTYESLPEKYRPLPGRQNIILTRTKILQLPSGVLVWESLEGNLQAVKEGKSQIWNEELWIAGGEQVYRQSRPFWDAVFITLVNGRHEGDAVFPEFEDDFELVAEEEKTFGKFLEYKRC